MDQIVELYWLAETGVVEVPPLVRFVRQLFADSIIEDALRPVAGSDGIVPLFEDEDVETAERVEAGLQPGANDAGQIEWTDEQVDELLKLEDVVDLERLRLHDVRHFMPTTMLTEGVPVSVVAGRLGHSRAATTLNVYSHFVEAGDHDAADLISDMLSNGDDETE